MHIQKELLSDTLESVEFWRQLSPALNITDHPFAQMKPAYELGQGLQEKMRVQMIEDGYFHIPPVLDQSEVDMLRRLVLNLDDHRIMPLFSAVYDEFWAVIGRIRNILSPVLGENYRLIPDFWVWIVAVDDSVGGCGPHRDGEMLPGDLRDDGTSKLCTAWIALTDVDTAGSCIYVLPRKYDAIFQDFVRRKFGQQGIPNPEQVPMPLERIRALPISAGSIIGWDQNLLHWGSGSSKWASGPRISIGVYYQAADTSTVGRPFDEGDRTYVDAHNCDTELTFTQRLRIIANNIEIYRHNLDNKIVLEPHYNDVFREFRDKWKFGSSTPE